MAIDISTPAGEQPRALVLEAVTELFDQVLDANAASTRPPQLGPAVDHARQMANRGQVAALERALLDVAHASLASLVRVRAAIDPTERT